MATRYDKLVRDRIPEIIHAKGGTAVIHIADNAEYVRTLQDKLQEEVDEFIESGSSEELADILEVVEAIALNKGIGWRDLMRLKRQKRQERGGFGRRIILDEAEDVS